MTIQSENNSIYQNVLPSGFQAPPVEGLFDERALSDVFRAPHVGLVAPDAVVWKDRMVPNVPGAPVTTGLMQVCYDDQAEFDRSKTWQTGPVVSFFRNVLKQQKTVRQP